MPIPLYSHLPPVNLPPVNLVLRNLIRYSGNSELVPLIVPDTPVISVSMLFPRFPDYDKVYLPLKTCPALLSIEHLVESWAESIRALISLREHFPDLRILGLTKQLPEDLITSPEISLSQVSEVFICAQITVS